MYSCPCGGEELVQPFAEREVEVDAAIRHQPLSVFRGEVVAVGRFPGKRAFETGGDDFGLVHDRRRVGVRPESLPLRRDGRVDRRVDFLQFRDRLLGRRPHARVDLRLVLAEIADDARVVGRERMRRQRHPPLARHAQRLALKAEVAFERVGPQSGFTNVKHGVPPLLNRSLRRWIRRIRRVPGARDVHGPDS